MLIFTSTNIIAKATGIAKVIPKKIHRIKTTSTNGIDNETSVRGKVNYNITITEMSQDNYDKMLDIFRLENDFGFMDTERGFDGQSYYLDMDEFSLNEIENKDEKVFYYSGAFLITKY